MRILDSFPDPIFDPHPENEGPQTVVLGGGCFWCVEGVFRDLPGVLKVMPGYAGGTADSADYKTVSTGRTGHAEVVAVTYDPKQISLGQVYKVFFWLAHDPTQDDGQGNDIGPQYRSAIFTADDHQHAVAEQYIRQIDKAGVFDAPVHTRLEPLVDFYVAEDYHHDYAARHPDEAYIRSVALPKVKRTREIYGKSQAA